MWRSAILQKAEASLLDEKAAKLRGLAQVLDDMLGDSFDLHLTHKDEMGQSDDDKSRLEGLSEALRPLTDRLAAAFPQVGLGYFDRKLNRIVAYAPSDRLGYLVGVVPPPDHLGRVAMERRTVRIATGSMVRGDALNCMHPIIRGGEVLGFAFANESVDDIYRQIQSGDRRRSQSSDLPIMLGLSSLAVFAGTSELSARAIRDRLAQVVETGVVEQPAVLPLMGALQQVEHYVGLFLNNLRSAVIMVDAQDRIHFCNKEVERLWGCKHAQLRGKVWSQVAVNSGLVLPPEVRSVMVEDQPQLFQASALMDGQVIDFDLLVAALPGLPGYRLYLFEERDRATREDAYFERAERLALAGELATSIAHEIRNPLTVVAGSIQLIPDRVDDQEFLLSLSRIAGEELARVNRIIQGLLGFARFSEPERALIDLRGLIETAVEFLGWYAKKHGIKVVTDLCPGQLKVLGDGEHLRQALLNLMMNGIQAMEETGGRLTIRMYQPEESRSVRISVSDQGPGIPPELVPNIWEVFYSSKQGGTGLGLPVVQRIIDAHRGFIEVDSTPGEGSCFTVLLPVAVRSDLVGRGEADGGTETVGSG